MEVSEYIKKRIEHLEYSLFELKAEVNRLEITDSVRGTFLVSLTKVVEETEDSYSMI